MSQKLRRASSLSWIADGKPHRRSLCCGMKGAARIAAGILQQNPALQGVNFHYSWTVHPLTQIATFIRAKTR